MPDIKPLTHGTLQSVSRPSTGIDNTTMLFHIRTDSDLHPIDLKTILRCVKHAEGQETIPKIPLGWWIKVWQKHGELNDY